jgi:nucleoside-diphosphate-sugar epimerase
MKKVLVSGADSGLGRYLHESFQGTGYTRATDAEQLAQDHYDVIIHCAFNRCRDVTSETLHEVVADNILLTSKLLELSHRKFIFISSIDVYPRSRNVYRENEPIAVEELSSLYGLTKLMAESLVRARSRNWIILRLSLLLGPYMRPNNVSRLLFEEHPQLTLTAESSFNVVAYDDVVGVIEAMIMRDLHGIYNVARKSNVMLRELSGLLGKRVEFGQATYLTGEIDNSKIVDIFPRLAQPSMQAILDFLGHGRTGPGGIPEGA